MRFFDTNTEFHIAKSITIMSVNQMVHSIVAQQQPNVSVQCEAPLNVGPPIVIKPVEQLE